MVPKADNNRRFACVNRIAQPAWPVNGAGHNTHRGHVMSLSIVAVISLLVLYTEEFVFPEVQ